MTDKGFFVVVRKRNTCLQTKICVCGSSQSVVIAAFEFLAYFGYLMSVRLSVTFLTSCLMNNYTAFMYGCVSVYLLFLGWESIKTGSLWLVRHFDLLKTTYILYPLGHASLASRFLIAGKLLRV